MAKQPRAKKTQARMRKVAAKGKIKTDAAAWLFVEVHWHDATSDGEWRAHDDLPNVSAIVSRGWLVRTTRLCITLAGSIAVIDNKDEGKNEGKRPDCGEVITIPRGCIIEICELAVKYAAKKKVTLN